MSAVAIEEALNQESSTPTAWANLGLWEAGDIYAAAAERLACTVADAAKLSAGHKVLDLGAGLGQQCALWHSRYAVNSITAINPDTTQTASLQAHLQSSDQLIAQAAPQALSSLPAQSLDVALSVDAAYFFPQRTQLLRELARVLRPGSLYAWTDIARKQATKPLTKLSSGLALSSLSLAGIDAQQLQTPAELNTQLSTLGWKLEHQRDLSSQVFTGFCQWWQHYRRQYTLPRSLRQRCALTAAALQANQRFGWWSYMLYVARTPG
nr:class I SAM-dependent methyltransferase [Oceanococcus sp. HetDA_MAG_MS8]